MATDLREPKLAQRGPKASRGLGHRPYDDSLEDILARIKLEGFPDDEIPRPPIRQPHRRGSLLHRDTHPIQRSHGIIRARAAFPDVGYPLSVQR